MTQANDNSAAALLALVNGYQVSQAIHAAAELRLADFIGDAPVTAAEVAKLVDADPGALYRLLRGLTSLGVFHELDDGRFVATPLSRLLHSAHPQSMRGWARFIGDEDNWTLWSDFTNSVRTGVNASQNLHGMSVWAYRAQRPERISLFSAAMATLSRNAVVAVLAAFDFSPFHRIVDIGGADGALLTEILRVTPGSTGTVFDLPGVIVEAAAVIEAAGVADRCTTVGGSYFEDLPKGGDAYLLKSILHDCPDSDCVRIMQRVRAAMAPGAALLIIERMIGEPNASGGTAMSDLNMLVATGGKERSLPEWKQLFASGGFELVRVVPTASQWFVIQACAAGAP